MIPLFSFSGYSGPGNAIFCMILAKPALFMNCRMLGSGLQPPPFGRSYVRPDGLWPFYVLGLCS